jgi:hypothetical protein
MQNEKLTQHEIKNDFFDAKATETERKNRNLEG